MRVSVMEVDINKFKNNIAKIKEYVGNKEIMPVVKAYAYGTYLNTNLDVLNMFNIVAVALVEEAKYIRKLGYKKDIFVLNQPSIDDIDDIINYNIKIGLSSKEFLDELIKRDAKITVHLEIETGMNRTGIKIDDLNSFIEKIKESKVVVEGIYTHFSSADDSYDYTNMQIKKFKCALKEASKYYDFKHIHLSSSSGFINFDDEVSNLVRPGIIMYGYEPFNGALDKIGVEPICKLKTKITYLKELDENEAISYGRKYKTTKKTKVATIPIGYADGLRKELINQGEVIVNGKKVPIIGSICMDSCMIDVTEIDCHVGDEVYIFDNDLIKVEDIALKCHTINYEILCDISARVPRIFID